MNDNGPQSMQKVNRKKELQVNQREEAVKDAFLVNAGVAPLLAPTFAPPDVIGEC